MHHHTARMLPKFSLRDHKDAGALWRCLVAAFPELVALCVMPNHVHLLLKHGDEAGRLPRALSGWARWRNHRGRTTGGWWQPVETPEPVSDDDKVRRMTRYIHLNPCRAGLVTDPLAWPWSTHRDRCGFAFPAATARNNQPARFHQYTSSDPSVHVAGSQLPKSNLEETRWEVVRDTVCSITRSEPEDLRKRGLPRRLAVQTAWICGVRDRGQMALATGLRKRQLRELTEDLPMLGSRIADPALSACVQAVGDPRFEGMPAFRPWGFQSPPSRDQARSDRHPGEGPDDWTPESDHSSDSE